MDLTRCQKSKKTQNGQMSLTANMNGTAELLENGRLEFLKFLATPTTGTVPRGEYALQG